MARPQKEGMDYFPHDTDAVNDEKIEILRSLYGNDGYAFYFILLERIYRSPNAEIDVSDAETIQVLARKVSVTPDKFAEIMHTALKWGCFCKKTFDERGILTSNGVKKRSGMVTAKRDITRIKYHLDKQIVSDAETTPETPQSKVKKSKLNNNTFVETDLPLILANELFELIQNNNPTVKQPNLQSWAGDIDRMIRLDKRSETQIQDVIQFSQADSFWQANILSAKKLREKYDQLYLKSKNKSNKPNAPPKLIAKKDKFKALYQS